MGLTPSRPSIFDRMAQCTARVPPKDEVPGWSPGAVTIFGDVADRICTPLSTETKRDRHPPSPPFYEAQFDRVRSLPLKEISRIVTGAPHHHVKLDCDRGRSFKALRWVGFPLA